MSQFELTETTAADESVDKLNELFGRVDRILASEDGKIKPGSPSVLFSANGEVLNNALSAKDSVIGVKVAQDGSVDVTVWSNGIDANSRTPGILSVHIDRSQEGSVFREVRSFYKPGDNQTTLLATVTRELDEDKDKLLVTCNIKAERQRVTIEGGSLTKIETKIPTGEIECELDHNGDVLCLKINNMPVSPTEALKFLPALQETANLVFDENGLGSSPLLRIAVETYKGATAPGRSDSSATSSTDEAVVPRVGGNPAAILPVQKILDIGLRPAGKDESGGPSKLNLSVWERVALRLSHDAPLPGSLPVPASKLVDLPPDNRGQGSPEDIFLLNGAPSDVIPSMKPGVPADFIPAGQAGIPEAKFGAGGDDTLSPRPGADFTSTAKSGVGADFAGGRQPGAAADGVLGTSPGVSGDLMPTGRPGAGWAEYMQEEQLGGSATDGMPGPVPGAVTDAGQFGAGAQDGAAGQIPEEMFVNFTPGPQPGAGADLMQGQQPLAGADFTQGQPGVGATEGAPAQQLGAGTADGAPDPSPQDMFVNFTPGQQPGAGADVMQGQYPMAGTDFTQGQPGGGATDSAGGQRPGDRPVGFGGAQPVAPYNPEGLGIYRRPSVLTEPLDVPPPLGAPQQFRPPTGFTFECRGFYSAVLANPNLSSFPNELSLTDVITGPIARLALDFLNSENRAGRQAAIEGLKDLVLNGVENARTDAKRVLKELLLADAVQRLRVSPEGSAQQMEALTDIALLEQADLQGRPGLLDANYPDHGLPQRAERVAEARRQAEQIKQQPDAALSEAAELLRSARTADERMMARARFERIANYHLPETQNPKGVEFTQANRWVQSIDRANVLRDGLRELIADPTGQGAPRAESLINLTRNERDPFAEFIITELRKDQTNGFKLLEQAYSGDANALRQHFSSLGPCPMAELATGAETARILRGVLTYGVSEDKQWLRKKLTASPEGRELLNVMDQLEKELTTASPDQGSAQRIHDLQLGICAALSQPELRSLVQKELNVLRVMGVGRDVLFSDQSSPTSFLVRDELSKTVAGKEFLQACLDPTKIDERARILANPQKLAEILKALCALEREVGFLTVQLQPPATAADVMNKFSLNPEAVKHARAEAMKRDDATFKAAELALADGLSRKEPQSKTRDDALSKLEKLVGERLTTMGSDHVTPAFHWLRTANLALALNEAPDAAAFAKALESLGKEAGQDYAAARFMLAFGGKIDCYKDIVARLRSDDAAIKEATFSTVRQLAALASKTRPEDISKALQAVAAAAEKGEPIAVAFLHDKFRGENTAAKIQEARNFAQELLADVPDKYERLRELVPSATDEMDDMRTRRILNEIGPNSGVDQYDKAIEKLRVEAEKHDNRSAAEWLKWAEATRELTTINKAGAGSESVVTGAVNRLETLALAGNEYARAALVSLLATSADKDRVLEAYGRGDFKCGRHLDKPVYMPETSQLSDSVRQQLGLAALASVERIAAQKQCFTKQECTLLALAYSEAARQPDSPTLNPRTADGAQAGTRLDAVLQQLTNAGGKHRTNAMDGMYQILSSDLKGTLGTAGLADIYIKGSGEPLFTQHFGEFSRLSLIGHEGALRIMAAAAAGHVENVKLFKGGAEAMELFARVQGDRARDTLLRAYSLYGDRYELLKTLGTVAQMNDNLNSETRAALRDGLRALEKTGLSAADQDALRRSAIAGTMAVHTKWEPIDAKLLLSKLTPEMVPELMRVADKIPRAPEDVRRHIVDELIPKIKVTDGVPHPEAMLALETLRAFPQLLTAEEVNGLVKFAKTDLPALKNMTQAERDKFDNAVGVTLISVMARGEGAAAMAAYRALAPEYTWHGLKTSGPGSEKFREALIDYAQGRPTDLTVSQEVAILLYDAGIRRPTAGLFKDAGMPGSDIDQFMLVEQAIAQVQKFAPGKTRREAEEFIRDVLTRAEAYNSLPDYLRQAISGDGQFIDNKMLIRQLSVGSFFQKDCPSFFLNQDVLALVNQQQQKFAQKIAEGAQEISDVNSQRQQVLRELGEETKKGVSTSQKVGDAAIKVFTAPARWVGAVDESDVRSSVDDYEIRQGEKIRTLQRLDLRVQALQEQQKKPTMDVAMCRLAAQVGYWNQLIQNGDYPAADRAAFQMWGQYGSELQNCAPAIWNDLTRGGDRPIDRNAFKRAHFHSLGSLSEMPSLSPGSPQGFDQGVALLRDTNGGYDDARAVRRQAVSAIDADPLVAKVVAASGAFAADMSVLFGSEEPKILGMFEAGLEGTKFDEFVNDARRRAGNVQAALNSVTQQDVADIHKRADQLTKLLPSITDAQTRKDIQDRIKNLNDLAEIFDRNSEKRAKLGQALQMIQSPKFDANTFANWLKKEGVVFLVSIAAAVAAVATMGGSLLIVAAVSSAAALTAGEATKEVLFALDCGLGPGERSAVGDYFSGKPEIDPATGKPRPRELFKDVLAPYAERWALDTLVCFATMGIGKYASSGINKLGSKATTVLARHSGRIARMQSSMRQVASRTTNDTVRAGCVKRFLTEVGDECLDELKENIIQDQFKDTAVEQGLDRMMIDSERGLSFVAATLLATGKGVSFSRIKGTNFVEIDCNPSNIASVFKGYENAGATVYKRADGVTAEVRIDGKTFIVGPKNHLRGELPSTSTGPGGEASAAQKKNRLGADAKVADLTGEVVLLPDNQTWSPNDKALAVRKDLQAVVDALNAGDFGAALRSAEQGTSSNGPGKIDQTYVDVKLNAADLNNPAILGEFLARMQHVGEVRQAPDNDHKSPADRVFSVQLPRPIIALGSGVEVDLRNPSQAIGPTARQLSGAEQASIKAILDSPAGKRILQEQALITLEERIVHVGQLQNGGVVISPTYAQFLANNAAGPDGQSPGNEYHFALKPRQDGGGRTAATYEQELVTMLYDAGLPLDAIKHHFAKQWNSVRTPVFDHLTALDKGQTPPSLRPAAPVDAAAAATVLRRNPDLSDSAAKVEAIKNLPGADPALADKVARLVQNFDRGYLPGEIADAISDLAAQKTDANKLNDKLAEIASKLENPALLKNDDGLKNLLDQHKSLKNDPLNPESATNGRNALALRKIYEDRASRGALDQARLEKLMALDPNVRESVDSLLLKNKITDQGLLSLLALDKATIKKIMEGPEGVRSTMLGALNKGLVGREASQILDLPATERKACLDFLGHAILDKTNTLDRSIVLTFGKLNTYEQYAVLRSLDGGMSPSDVKCVMSVPARVQDGRTTHDTEFLVAAFKKGVINREMVEAFAKMPGDVREGVANSRFSDLLNKQNSGLIFDAITKGELSTQDLATLSGAKQLHWVTDGSLTLLMKESAVVRRAVLAEMSTRLPDGKSGQYNVPSLIERAKQGTRPADQGTDATDNSNPVKRPGDKASEAPVVLRRTDAPPATIADVQRHLAELTDALKAAGIDPSDVDGLEDVSDALLKMAQSPGAFSPKFLGEQAVYVQDLRRAIAEKRLTTAAQITELVDYLGLRDNFTNPNYAANLDAVWDAYVRSPNAGRNLDGMMRWFEEAPKPQKDKAITQCGNPPQIHLLGMPGWKIEGMDEQGNCILRHNGEMRINQADLNDPTIKRNFTRVGNNVNPDGTVTVRVNDGGRALGPDGKPVDMVIHVRPELLLMQTMTRHGFVNDCAYATTAFLRNVSQEGGVPGIFARGDVMTAQSLRAKIGDQGNIDHNTLLGMVQQHSGMSLEAVKPSLDGLKPGIYVAVAKGADRGNSVVDHTFIITVDANGRALMLDAGNGGKIRPIDNTITLTGLHKLNGAPADRAAKNLGLDAAATPAPASVRPGDAPPAKPAQSGDVPPAVKAGDAPPAKPAQSGDVPPAVKTGDAPPAKPAQTGDVPPAVKPGDAPPAKPARSRDVPPAAKSGDAPSPKPVGPVTRLGRDMDTDFTSIAPKVNETKLALDQLVTGGKMSGQQRDAFMILLKAGLGKADPLTLKAIGDKLEQLSSAPDLVQRIPLLTEMLKNPATLHLVPAMEALLDPKMPVANLQTLSEFMKSDAVKNLLASKDVAAMTAFRENVTKAAHWPDLPERLKVGKELDGLFKEVNGFRLDFLLDSNIPTAKLAEFKNAMQSMNTGDLVFAIPEVVQALRAAGPETARHLVENLPEMVKKFADADDAVEKLTAIRMVIESTTDLNNMLQLAQLFEQRGTHLQDPIYKTLVERSMREGLLKAFSDPANSYLFTAGGESVIAGLRSVYVARGLESQFNQTIRDRFETMMNQGKAIPLVEKQWLAKNKQLFGIDQPMVERVMSWQPPVPKIQFLPGGQNMTKVISEHETFKSEFTNFELTGTTNNGNHLIQCKDSAGRTNYLIVQSGPGGEAKITRVIDLEDSPIDGDPLFIKHLADMDPALLKQMASGLYADEDVRRSQLDVSADVTRTEQGKVENDTVKAFGQSWRLGSSLNRTIMLVTTDANGQPAIVVVSRCDSKSGAAVAQSYANMPRGIKQAVADVARPGWTMK